MACNALPHIVQCGHWCSGKWQGSRWFAIPTCCLCLTVQKGMLKTDWDYVTLMRTLVEECCETCKGREPEHYAEAQEFINEYDAGNYDARIGEE